MTRHSARAFAFSVAFAGVLFAVACGDTAQNSPDNVVGDTSDVVGETAENLWVLEWLDSSSLPETVASGEVLNITAIVKHGGVPTANVSVKFEIVLGGGRLSVATAVSDADGKAAVAWTVGTVPIREAVRASIEEAPVFVDIVVQVEAGAAIVPVPFGDIEGMLTTEGMDGTTEGLTFDDSGNLYLAVKDALFKMAPDGTADLIEVTGAGLNAPLGMAWDFLRKEIWIADTASVKRVTPAGVATVVATTDGVADLVTPNSLAIRDNKYVYGTDSCTGRVFRIDAETEAVEVVATFNPAEQGGPNGLAFDESGQLFVTTENVGLLCIDLGLDPTTNVGGLYKLDISGGLPATPVPVVEKFAMFGDGLAFDQDGNLYVIFDTFDGFNLVESAVWIFPQGGAEGHVKAISIPDRLLANIAWGYDDFGSTMVYFSLLKVALTTEARGAMKAEVGIGGMSLLPADLP